MQRGPFTIRILGQKEFDAAPRIEQQLLLGDQHAARKTASRFAGGDRQAQSLLPGLDSDSLALLGDGRHADENRQTLGFSQDAEIDQQSDLLGICLSSKRDEGTAAAKVLRVN
ncbi:MAG TPA: hypothetical protein VF410_06980, partial [Rhizomicrobium sp.]